MKKIIFAMLGICVMLCSFSCTDDNDGTGSEADLVGTWLPVEGLDICIEHTDYGVFEDKYELDLRIMEYSSDGTFRIYYSDSGELEIEGTYTYKNDEVTLSVVGDDGSTYVEVNPLVFITPDEILSETYRKDEPDERGYYYEYILRRVWKRKK